MSFAVVSLSRWFASFVKLEHTVFALFFAYVGLLLAVVDLPFAAAWLWVIVAMVGARIFAMGLNCLIDVEVDAYNLRTVMRELLFGMFSQGQVALLCALALAVFLVAVFQFDLLVRWLWLVSVVFFAVYLYLKRVMWLCHLWLGVLLGLAPVGAWAAVTGELPWQAWALGGAVAFWVVGFDFFYLLFDLEYDRSVGLQSWAVRFGERGVFAGAWLFHLGAVALFAAAGLGLEVGVFYWLGVVAVAVLLGYEYSFVRPGDLGCLDAVFFMVNGVISIVFFGFVLADVLL